MQQSSPTFRVFIFSASRSKSPGINKSRTSFTLYNRAVVIPHNLSYSFARNRWCSSHSANARFSRSRMFASPTSLRVGKSELMPASLPSARCCDTRSSTTLSRWIPDSAGAGGSSGSLFPVVVLPSPSLPLFGFRVNYRRVDMDRGFLVFPFRFIVRCDIPHGSFHLFRHLVR
jgi:hypothetical protein